MLNPKIHSFKLFKIAQNGSNKNFRSFSDCIYIQHTITLLKTPTFFSFYSEQKMNTNQPQQQQPFWLLFLLHKRTQIRILQVILFYLYFIGCPKSNYLILLFKSSLNSPFFPFWNHSWCLFFTRIKFILDLFCVIFHPQITEQANGSIMYQ